MRSLLRQQRTRCAELHRCSLDMRRLQNRGRHRCCRTHIRRCLDHCSSADLRDYRSQHPPMRARRMHSYRRSYRSCQRLELQSPDMSGLLPAHHSMRNWLPVVHCLDDNTGSQLQCCRLTFSCLHRVQHAGSSGNPPCRTLDRSEAEPDAYLYMRIADEC